MDLSQLSSRAIIGRFYETLEIAEGESWAQQVSFESPSDQASETYKFLGQTPRMREWLGGREAKALRVNGFTIENKKYEFTLDIELDDIRRDKTKQIMVRVDEAADGAGEDHWAKLLSTLVTTNGTCYDGQNFFDTDHSEGDSGTQTNALTSSDVGALNVSSTSDVTAVEAMKIMLGLASYFTRYKDDRGEPINGNAKQFVVVVPPQMHAGFQEAAVSKFLSGNAGAESAIPGSGMSFKVVSNARFTASTVGYIFRIDGRVKPFIRQIEVPLETQMIGEGSEHEFTYDSWLFGGKMVGNVGLGLWQHAIKFTIS